MWSTILGINSFILWPASFIFLIYAAGHTVLFLTWKMLVIAMVFFAITTVAGIVFAILSD